MNSLATLLNIASPDLASDRKLIEALPGQLESLYTQKNGFYAFEGALYVLPVGKNLHHYDVLAWNENTTWRSLFDIDLSGICFFGMDIFGEQYGLSTNVVKFNPETAELHEIGADIEDWANLLLRDHEVEVGSSLAHAWQKEFGALKYNERLIPKLPFILGGEYELSNLIVKDVLEGFPFRASIANQIINTPDGQPIQIVIE